MRKGKARTLMKRFFLPVLTILLCLGIAFLFPPGSSFQVTQLPAGSKLADYYDGGTARVALDVRNLYYSGCTYEQNNRLKGYYYYTLSEDTCQYYILPANQFEFGHPSEHVSVPIEQATLSGQITCLNDSEYKHLLQTMAQHISWTQSGLSDVSSPYVLSVTTSSYQKRLLLYGVMAFCLLVACADIILHLKRRINQ